MNELKAEAKIEDTTFTGKAQLSGEGTTFDTISRMAAIDAILGQPPEPHYPSWYAERIKNLPSAQSDHIADGSIKVGVESKYEYHYDHPDCIWYRPEARNRCPSTCAQYRDGWNDAMQYIFRDGKGYRPYRRDKRYEGSD